MDITTYLYRRTKPRRHIHPAAFAACKTFATLLMGGLPALLVLAPPRSATETWDPDMMLDMEHWLGHADFDQGLHHRLAAVVVAALVACSWAAWWAWTRTPLTEPFSMPHADDASLYYGEYAERQFQAELDRQYGSSSKRGIRLSKGVRLPFEAEAQFILVVGDKGSGKSNIVRALGAQVIKRGDLTLIHCVKGDVTQAFGANEAVLIAAHHADGWAWDVAADISGEAGFKELAAATIPLSDNAPFWGETARAVFIDIAQELAQERAARGESWDFNDLTRRILEDPMLIEQRIRMLDLSSAPLIASGEDGLSNTAFGVLATLWSAALSGLRPLAIAWASTPEHRRFSVRAWLSTHWSGPRTVILQTSPAFREMSKIVSANLLSRVVDLITDASLPNDPNRRVTLVLDEMHALGRISGFDSLLALGREKGLVVIGALQSFGQLKSIYGSDIGSVVQDLFKFRIFCNLSAGESSDIAAKLIGERTIVWQAWNATPAKDDKRLWVEKTEKRPIISGKVLQGELGVRVVREARWGRPAVKEVHAVVSGMADVYRLVWPMTIWPKRRDGYRAAAWLTAPRRLAQPPRALPPP